MSWTRRDCRGVRHDPCATSPAPYPPDRGLRLHDGEIQRGYNADLANGLGNLVALYENAVDYDAFDDPVAGSILTRAHAAGLPEYQSG